MVAMGPRGGRGNLNTYNLCVCKDNTNQVWFAEVVADTDLVPPVTFLIKKSI